MMTLLSCLGFPPSALELSGTSPRVQESEVQRGEVAWAGDTTGGGGVQMRGWRLLLPSWRKVKASPGPVPPNPPGTCQQGQSQAGLHCGLGEITVSHCHYPKGQVTGGLSASESNSAACAANENENMRMWPSPGPPLGFSRGSRPPPPQAFQHCNASGLMGFNSTHPRWGKEPAAFFPILPPASYL